MPVMFCLFWGVLLLLLGSDSVRQCKSYMYLHMYIAVFLVCKMEIPALHCSFAEI